MLFTEPAFLFIFLPVLLGLYYASPGWARNTILTVASLAFYAVGEWRFLGWLLGSTALNYGIARGLAAWRGRPRAHVLLGVGIAADLALLVVFKYAGFLVANANHLLTLAGKTTLSVPPLALPLGISFFTFHKISYKIDVARGVAEVRRNPLDLLLYILLFPQLIAGPIVRYRDIAGELVARVVSRRDFAEGVRRFLLGLGKKMLVANIVGQVADAIFAIVPGQLSTPLAWLGILAYAVQIYFDFSGYSDMAIGLARLFGFHFLENFHYPYTASSVTEFWRRWHISLSRWFRDYLYIPLGGNRGSGPRTYLNLVIVFLLCGAWHGASWTFVVWGVFHGVALVVERLFCARVLAVLPRPLRHAYTLGMVLVGWAIFRAPTLPHAWTFLRAMAGAGASQTNYLATYYLDPRFLIAFGAGVVGSLPWLPWVAAVIGRNQARRGWVLAAEGALVLAGHAALLTIFLFSLFQVSSQTYNPFIYFRF